MGQYVLDPWILKLAGVPQELWRIQDYASDLLVLRLASGVTLEKVSLVENERVMYTWATMIWFTSFLKPLGKDNSLANKQNMVAETLAVIFLVSRRDTPNPRHLTSKPAEHTFGSMRVVLREPTVHEMTELVEKIELKLKAMYESNLVGTRSRQKVKRDINQHLKNNS
eukprot:scaffold503_cov71-Attheya_sp.AAC.2